MKPAPFEYLCAADTEAALALIAGPADGPSTKVCGGTQSLGPMLNLRLASVDRLVDVSRIPALLEAGLHDEVLRIGAAVTHASIEDGALPDVTLGMLPAVAAGIAYRAVRNRGTLGGSLAHADPRADWVSTMCLLDAGLRLRGPGGERCVRATDFFVGPFTTVLCDNEVLVAVDVPRFSPGARWAYRKTCRKPGEFAEAIGAAWVDPGRGVARALIGSLDRMPLVIDGEAAIAALAEDDAMARVLDDAGLDDAYGRQVHRVMLRRALADLGRAPGVGA